MFLHQDLELFAKSEILETINRNRHVTYVTCLIGVGDVRKLCELTVLTNPAVSKRNF